MSRDDLWDDWPRPTHCSGCGRELVEVTEPDGYDPETGDRKFDVWLQCPRYPRNGLVYLLRGGATHTSTNKAMPLLDREYR